VTGRAAALRYARALFDVALKDGDPERIERELSAFAGVVAANESLGRVLAHPAIPAGRKRAVVDELIGRAGAVAPPLARTLQLLADRDRLGLLPDLAEAYAERLMQHQQVLRAEVTTAVPLPDDQLAEIANGLSTATGRKVTMTTRIDPAIIGGAVARIGSTVYDGSVARQLERLKERLTEAS
jgi:F-type H+-transporting ATPase subunit delta